MALDEVVQYLAAASSAGIVGNTAYARVQRLSNWMRERLGWTPTTPIPPGATLSEDQLQLLQFMFEDALKEWKPSQANQVTANQVVQAGRDITGHVTNQAIHEQ